jgi:hypothetical protein
VSGKKSGTSIILRADRLLYGTLKKIHRVKRFSQSGIERLDSVGRPARLPCTSIEWKQTENTYHNKIWTVLTFFISWETNDDGSDFCSGGRMQRSLRLHGLGKDEEEEKEEERRECSPVFFLFLFYDVGNSAIPSQ